MSLPREPIEEPTEAESKFLVASIDFYDLLQQFEQEVLRCHVNQRKMVYAPWVEKILGIWKRWQCGEAYNEKNKVDNNSSHGD